MYDTLCICYSVNGPKSHCSLLAYINIRKELLQIRDKAKIKTLIKTDPRARQNVRIPGGRPGGWSGLELTDTLVQMKGNSGWGFRPLPPA